MAHSDDWNAAFEGLPSGAEIVSTGDNKIRDLKKAIRERMELEHKWKDSQIDDGKHLVGSARAYMTTTAPTTQPNGSALNATDDLGRMWFDSDDGYKMYLWSGANFVVPSNLEVGNTLSVAGAVHVVGAATFAGAVTIDTNPSITGTLTVGGALTVTSDLEVTGTTTLADLTVTGSFAPSTLGGAILMTDTLQVTGGIDIEGNGSFLQITHLTVTIAHTATNGSVNHGLGDATRVVSVIPRYLNGNTRWFGYEDVASGNLKYVDVSTTACIAHRGSTSGTVTWGLMVTYK